MVDAPAAVVVCEPAALPTAAAVVSCEICMGELTMSQMVRLSCKHLVCGACVLEIRRSYEEQPGSSLEDQIDVTYDGTQPSYAAPPCCPYCRHPITADELAVAAAAAAPLAPAAADELAVAAATPQPMPCLPARWWRRRRLGLLTRQCCHRGFYPLCLHRPASLLRQ